MCRSIRWTTSSSGESASAVRTSGGPAGLHIGCRDSRAADRRSQKASVGAAQADGVAVTDGVVRLAGTLTDERERLALRVTAKNVPGAKSVEDHLVWIEPNAGIMASIG